MNRRGSKSFRSVDAWYPAVAATLTTACKTSSPLLSAPDLVGFLPLPELALFFPLCDMLAREEGEKQCAGQKFEEGAFEVGCDSKSTVGEVG